MKYIKENLLRNNNDAGREMGHYVGSNGKTELGIYGDDAGRMVELDIYYDMKKEHIYLFLVLATFIVSFVSLGFSLPRDLSDIGIDYLGIIVAILAVLVTILIGLQLYNYIFARENIKQIVDEEIRKMLQDYGHTTDARDCLQNGFEIVVSDFDCPRITDAIMKALQEVTKCESIEMRQQTLDYIMMEAHKLCTEYSKKGRYIKVGMRADYLYIVKQIDHKYVPELTEYLKTAVEKE